MAYYGLLSQRINIINQEFKLSIYLMNIKITIKDEDTSPLLFHKNQLTQVQSKKKNALYQQPQRDRNQMKKEKSVNQPTKAPKDEKSLRQTGLRSSGQDESYRKAQKKMMEDLDKISKNQASLDMIHNSNNILKKQNQILEENQKTLYNLAKTGQKKQNYDDNGKQFVLVLGQIKKEVQEMKKIKEEIQKTSKEFTKNLNQTGKSVSKQVSAQVIPNNITQMNANLKNLAQISKNQLDGLQNMEAIKHLQNFNIEAYGQAINGLKKQIVQYQKQSQQIERQLKLRAAKLQKFDIHPNFDEELLVPYQNYLKKRADAIDLHAIKQKTYEKLGQFDYGKFEYDISQIMAQVKGQMNQFGIVCKQYRIEVPQIKIDQKQLKGLDLKLPSAIDQYKAERGIDFGRQAQTNKMNSTEDFRQSNGRNNKKKGEAVVSLKQDLKKKSQRYPQAIRELNTKPLDLTTQVKLQKTNQPAQKTVLQNNREREKKSVQGNYKKTKVVKQDEDFQKYLQYRAREELELLYKQKKQRLEKKQNQLYQFCKDQPQVYLNLDLRNQVRRDHSLQRKRQEHKSPKKPEQTIKKQQQEQSQKIPQLKPILGSQGQAIKSVGTQILKQKLKNLLGGGGINAPRRPPENYQQNVQQNISQPMPKLQNVAQNFLSLINNTLTQVNNQLSKTIQNRYQQKSKSKQKQQIYRKSPPKLTFPKMEQFRPPPIFNMANYAQPNSYYPQHIPMTNPSVRPQPVVPQQKIIEKDYDHLKIGGDEQKYGDLELELSQEDNYKEDFE